MLELSCSRRTTFIILQPFVAPTAIIVAFASTNAMVALSAGSETFDSKSERRDRAALALTSSVMEEESASRSLPYDTATEEGGALETDDGAATLGFDAGRLAGLGIVDCGTVATPDAVCGGVTAGAVTTVAFRPAESAAIGVEPVFPADFET
jgi:hypothetical protein